MSGVDVPEVMQQAIEDCVWLRKNSTKTMELTPEELEQVLVAIVELARCCKLTVEAFEALGRPDGIVAQLESHRACERALIEQKAALVRFSGEQP